MFTFIHPYQNNFRNLFVMSVVFTVLSVTRFLPLPAKYLLPLLHVYLLHFWLA